MKSRLSALLLVLSCCFLFAGSTALADPLASSPLDQWRLRRAVDIDPGTRERASLFAQAQAAASELVDEALALIRNLDSAVVGILDRLDAIEERSARDGEATAVRLTSCEERLTTLEERINGTTDPGEAYVQCKMTDIMGAIREKIAELEGEESIAFFDDEYSVSHFYDFFLNSRDFYTTFMSASSIDYRLTHRNAEGELPLVMDNERCNSCINEIRDYSPNAAPFSWADAAEGCRINGPYAQCDFHIRKTLEGHHRNTCAGIIQVVDDYIQFR